MTVFRTAAWLAALLLALAGRAPAQEVQVPIDEAGRIETVDARLASRLGLFLDRYPDLAEVRLFQAPDSSYLLEVTSRRDGRLVRRRVPLGAEEVLALRQAVAERVVERAPAAVVDQDGRNLLLSQTALLGFGFYGPLVPYSLGVEDPSTATGLYLLTAGAGFFVPYLLTQREPVTRPQALLSGYGATRGAVHGLFLHQLVAGEDDDCCTTVPEHDVYEHDDREERARAAAAVLASAAEGIGGYLWARRAEMTPGEATAIGLGGDFGLGLGLGTAYLAGSEDVGTRATAGLALAGSAAGIVGGRWLAQRRDFTAGDVGVAYTVGVVGTGVAAAAADLVNLDDRPIVAAAMLGAGAGLYLGDRLVRDTDFSTSQASLNALGTGAGALVGLGLGILVGGEDLDETVAVVGTAAGAAAGFAFTYAALAPAAREQQGEARTSWRVRVDPRGVLGAASGKAPSDGRAPVPVVSLQYRF